MLHALLRRDRAVVLAGLVAVILLAWAYLILGAGIEMDEMDMGGGRIMMMAPPWTLGYAALIFLMWAIMMMAMMLPSAAPTILLVTALARDRIAPVAVPFAFGFGLDRAAAKQAFDGFTQGRKLTAHQLEFVDMMIDHLTARGAMDPRLLYESPFTDIDPLGVAGVFKEGEVVELIRILQDVRGRAAA
jgi:EcoEI R protein C-terminal/Predicted metal-binding integral membrane protein (DUF2182)